MPRPRVRLQDLERKKMGLNLVRVRHVYQFCYVYVTYNLRELAARYELGTWCNMIWSTCSTFSVSAKTNDV